MSSLSRLLCCVGVVFKFAVIVAADSTADLQALPRLLEVDVIFPRNDTYKPVFPFPIVIAARGLPAADPHGLRVQLTMGPRGPFSKFIGEMHYSPGDLAKATDVFYMIDSDFDIINSTSASWELHWLFLLDPNCTVTKDDPNDRNNNTEIKGSIKFTIDKEGKLPDIVPLDDSCPVPIASFNMTGADDYTPVNGPNDCFVYVDHPADPCAVKGTSLLESKVRSKMEGLLCDGRKWPQDSQKFICPVSAAPLTQPILRAVMIAGALLWAAVFIGI